MNDKVNLEKASPTEMRTSLEMVMHLKMSGIGFIPIPYFSEEERKALAKQADTVLKRILND